MAEEGVGDGEHTYPAQKIRHLKEFCSVNCSILLKFRRLLLDIADFCFEFVNQAAHIYCAVHARQ